MGLRNVWREERWRIVEDGWRGSRWMSLVGPRRWWLRQCAPRDCDSRDVTTKVAVRYLGRAARLPLSRIGASNHCSRFPRPIFAIAILNDIGYLCARTSCLLNLSHHEQHKCASKGTAQFHKRLGACSCSWGRPCACMTSPILPSANSVSKSITCCKR